MGIFIIKIFSCTETDPVFQKGTCIYKWNNRSNGEKYLEQFKPFEFLALTSKNRKNKSWITRIYIFPSFETQRLVLKAWISYSIFQRLSFLCLFLSRRRLVPG